MDSHVPQCSGTETECPVTAAPQLAACGWSAQKSESFTCFPNARYGIKSSCIPTKNEEIPFGILSSPSFPEWVTPFIRLEGVAIDATKGQYGTNYIPLVASISTASIRATFVNSRLAAFAVHPLALSLNSALA
jgi:hypothetical protein